MCRKNFAIALQITISGFAVSYSFTWQFKAEKEQQSFIMSLLYFVLVVFNRHTVAKRSTDNNVMAVLCGMPIVQYSARSARLSVHKLFTSCI